MEISIASPSAKFSDHLLLEQNSRIVFSGSFGTGKSYFLRNYFKANEKKYNLFWISPIHYVVGANQDIFEWIKIDIAKQLLAFMPEEKAKTMSNDFWAQAYVYQNS